MKRNIFHPIIANLIWALGNPFVSRGTLKVQQYINNLSKIEYGYLQGCETLQKGEVVEYFSCVAEPLADPSYPPSVIKEVCICVKRLYDTILCSVEETFGIVVTNLLLRNLAQLAKRNLPDLFPTASDANHLMDLLESIGRFAIIQRSLGYYERTKLIDLIIVFCSKLALDPTKPTESATLSYELQTRTLLKVLDFTDTRFCLFVVAELLRARKTPLYEQAMLANAGGSIGITNGKQQSGNQQVEKMTQSQPSGEAFNTTGTTTQGDENICESGMNPAGDGRPEGADMSDITTVPVESLGLQQQQQPTRDGEGVEQVNPPNAVNEKGGDQNSSGSNVAQRETKGQPRPKQQSQTPSQQMVFQGEQAGGEVPVNRDNFCNIITEPAALCILRSFFGLSTQVVRSMPWVVKSPTVLFHRNGGELEILDRLLQVDDLALTGCTEEYKESTSDNTNLFDDTLIHVLINLLLQNMKCDIMGTINTLYQMAFHTVFLPFIPLFLYNILSLLVVLYGTTEEEFTKTETGIIMNIFDKYKKRLKFVDLSGCKLKWNNLWNMSRDSRRRLRWTLLKSIRDWVIEPVIFDKLVTNCFEYKMYCSPLNAVAKFLSKVALNKSIATSNEAKVESLLALDTLILIVSKVDGVPFPTVAEDLFQYRKHVNSKIIFHNLSTALTSAKPSPETIEKIIQEHLNQLHLIGVIPKPNPHISPRTVALIILGLPISPESRSEIFSTESCVSYLTEAAAILIAADHRCFYRHKLNNGCLLELVRRFSRFVALGGEGQRMERLVNGLVAAAMELEVRKAEVTVMMGDNTVNTNNTGEDNLSKQDHSEATTTTAQSSNMKQQDSDARLRLLLERMETLEKRRSFNREDEMVFLVFGVLFLQTELNGKNRGKARDKTNIRNKEDFARFMANCETEKIYYGRQGLDGIFESIMEEELRPVRDICSAFIQEEFFYNNKKIESGNTINDTSRTLPSNSPVTLPVSHLSYSGLPITESMFETGNSDISFLSWALQEACNVCSGSNETSSNGAELCDYLCFPIKNKCATFTHSILHVLCATSMKLLSSASKGKEIKTSMAPIEIRIKAAQILARVASYDDDLGFATANEFLNMALYITNAMNSDILMGLSVMPVVRHYLTTAAVVISHIHKIPRSLMLNVFLTFVALDSGGKWIDAKDCSATDNKMFPFDQMPSGLVTPLDEFIRVNPLDKKKMGILEGIWRIGRRKEKGVYYKIADIDVRRLVPGPQLAGSPKPSEEGGDMDKGDGGALNGSGIAASLDFDFGDQLPFGFEDGYTPISMQTIPLIMRDSHMPKSAAVVFVEMLKKGRAIFVDEQEGEEGRTYNRGTSTTDGFATPQLPVLIREEIQSSLVHNPRNSLVRIRTTAVECGGIGRWGRGSCNGNSVGLMIDKEEGNIPVSSQSQSKDSVKQSLEINERGNIEETSSQKPENDKANIGNQSQPSCASSSSPRQRSPMMSVIENQVAPSISVPTSIGIYHSVNAKLNISFTDFVLSTLRFMGLMGICWAKQKASHRRASTTVDINGRERFRLLTTKGDDAPTSYQPRSPADVGSETGTWGRKVEAVKGKIGSMRKAAQLITESLLEIASAGEERSRSRFINKLNEKEEERDSKDSDGNGVAPNTYPHTIYYNQGDSLVPFVLRVTLLLTITTSKYVLAKRSKYGILIANTSSPTIEYISLIRTLMQKYSPSAHISSPFSIVNETIEMDEGDGRTRARSPNTTRSTVDVGSEPLLESAIVQASWECGEIDLVVPEHEEARGTDSLAALKPLVAASVDTSSVRECLSVVRLMVKCRESQPQQGVCVSSSHSQRNKGLAADNTQQGVTALIPERYVLQIPRVAFYNDMVLADAVRLACGLKCPDVGGKGCSKTLSSLAQMLGSQPPPLFAKALGSSAIEPSMVPFVADALNRWWNLPKLSKNIRVAFDQLFSAPLMLDRPTVRRQGGVGGMEAIASIATDAATGDVDAIGAMSGIGGIDGLNSLEAMGMPTLGVSNVLERLEVVWPFGEMEERERQRRERARRKEGASNEPDTSISQAEAADKSGLDIEPIISAVPSYAVAPLIILTRQILTDILERGSLTAGSGETGINQVFPKAPNGTQDIRPPIEAGGSGGNAKDEGRPKSNRDKCSTATETAMSGTTTAPVVRQAGGAGPTHPGGDNMATQQGTAHGTASPTQQQQRQHQQLQQNSQVMRRFLLLLLNTTPRGVCMRGTFVLQQILIPAILAGASWDVIGVAKVVYGNIINAVKRLTAGGGTQLGHVSLPGNEANISLLPSLLGWQLINALVSATAVTPTISGIVSAHIRSILLVGDSESWLAGPRLAECLGGLLQAM